MSELSQEERQYLEKGLQQLTAQYYKGMLELLAVLGTEELNYVRTPITMTNGGKYLLSLLHFDGPVLNLKVLRDEQQDVDAEVAKVKITSKKEET